MISNEAKKILSQDMDGFRPEETTLFFDHKGDSIAIRLFQFSNADTGGTAEERAAGWLNTAKNECLSPSGTLQTLMVAFPALGGAVDENNAVAIVAAYDLLATHEPEADPPC